MLVRSLKLRMVLKLLWSSRLQILVEVGFFWFFEVVEFSNKREIGDSKAICEVGEVSEAGEICEMFKDREVTEDIEVYKFNEITELRCFCLQL